MRILHSDSAFISIFCTQIMQNVHPLPYFLQVAKLIFGEITQISGFLHR